MNIVEKMKKDWDRRTQHHAKFWIATEEYEDDDIFSYSAKRDAGELLNGLGTYMRPSWRVLEVGCCYFAD